jgi:hypothetical protein
MTTKSIAAGIASIFLAAGFAPRLSGQSMSTLTHAKRAASRAVAATNEHTNREQMLGSGTAATAEKPAGSNRSAAPAHSGSAAPATARSSSGRPTASAGAAPTAKAPSKSAPAAPAAAKGAASPGDDPEKGPGKELTLMRESFTYSAEGRRDPFVSLIANGDLRPMISDLRLVTVIYAPQGRSVAIMRDVSTQEQYRVRAGQTLGRMRVARISPKSVTFTIEEYGFSRQEVLALNDTTIARSQ